MFQYKSMQPDMVIQEQMLPQGRKYYSGSILSSASDDSLFYEDNDDYEEMTGYTYDDNGYRI